MEQALQWASGGTGWNSPRPSVGCVLVKDGAIIGAGHTQRGDGQPHAEVMAIRSAAENNKSTFGATAYVTLEPCSHYATTPPCTKALIAAGIKRVVAGVCDPNPSVNGRGYRQLQEAGVEVVQNFMALECARHDDHFLKYISTDSPFVTLKSALSLDGKIALENGESQWITGAAARTDAHYLRHCHDAVLVGSGTAIADNPQLTVRLEGHYKQPARVVVDSRGIISADLRLFDASEFEVPIYVATTERMSADLRAALTARGAKVLLLPEQQGHIDLKVLLSELCAHGIYSILIEGGAGLAGAFLREQLVDKLVCYIAPILIGQGLDMVQGLHLSQLSDALRLSDVQTTSLDSDTRISGYLEPWASRMKQLCGVSVP